MASGRDILNRIRWDAVYGAGTFEIGCYDRVTGRVERRPFDPTCLESGRSRVTSYDAEGHIVHIPLHRIREVYRDGVLIWRRGHDATLAADAKPAAPPPAAGRRQA